MNYYALVCYNNAMMSCKSKAATLNKKDFYPHLKLNSCVMKLWVENQSRVNSSSFETRP